MKHEAKKLFLRKLRKLLRGALKEDWGQETEYLDRALDQVNFALEDIRKQDEQDSLELVHSRFDT